MRVLMDGRPLLRPWMGGVPRLAASLEEAIRRALHDNDELVIATSGLSPLLTKPARPTTRSVGGRERGRGQVVHKRIPNKIVALLTFTGLFSFDKFFRDQKADVLFFPNLEFIGHPRLPYTLLVHDLSFLIEPTWFGWKARIWHKLVKPKTLIRNAAHLFAVSQNTKDDLVRMLGIDDKRISVIPMGLDPLPELPSRKSDRRFILCLGGSNVRKNAGCIATAHAELVKDERYRDVELVTVGAAGSSRPTDAELFALMRDASVFCYPSWYEGFGMPLHEAARFGTPCIASTASSLPEIAPQGTRFASPAKPHHWTEAICQSLDNPATHKTHTDLGGWNTAGSIIVTKLSEIIKT